MLYIAAAMYIEAHPLIAYYHLKPDPVGKFQVFRSDSVTLIITGTGELKAAIALTWLLSGLEITTNDYFINYGCCGSISESILLGNTYICNKIKQQTTGFTVYPDLLDALSFEEASITTCPHVVTGSENTSFLASLTEPLIDMEAFGLYRAASCFFHTDQMLFVKTVTDRLTDSASSHAATDRPQLTASELSCMESAIVRCITEYETIILPRLVSSANHSRMTDKVIQLYETIKTQLHLSTTMQLTLKQHMIYYECMHDDLTSILGDYAASEEFSCCHSKTEGKRYYAELIAKLSS